MSPRQLAATAEAIIAPAIAASTRATSRRRRRARRAGARQRRAACGRNLASGHATSGVVHVSSMRAMHGAKTSGENVVTDGDARRRVASLQVDPLVDATWQPYAYASANPVMRIDPDAAQDKDIQEQIEDANYKLCMQLAENATTVNDKLNDPTTHTTWSILLPYVLKYLELYAKWLKYGCEELVGPIFPRTLPPFVVSPVRPFLRDFGFDLDMDAADSMPSSVQPSPRRSPSLKLPMLHIGQ